MANNLIQVKRTSVSGRAANSTTLPNPGELALNMTDGILYSTNGSTVFEIGANNTNAKVTGTLTVNAISANGEVGANNQRLTSNGSSAHWQDPLIKDLVDVAANGATDTQVLTYNSTLQKWINQNPPVANVIYTTGYYGVFYDTTTQHATGGSNTATVTKLANTFLTNGVTRTANDELQVAYDGVYKITYSLQFTSSSNKNEFASVWLRKNGVDVPDTSTDFGIYSKNGGTNGFIVAVTSLVDDADAGDKFQVMWATSSNTGVSMVYLANTAFSPETPSAIVDVTPISNIITAPPGGNTDVVFNDSGLSNAAAGFTFTKTTNSVFVANNLYIGNVANAQAFTVDGTFWANSTVVNSVSFQVDGAFTANSTLVNAAALLVRGGATVNGTLTVNAISANGGVGSPGQLLYSDGTKVYWNAASSTAGINVDAQYIWTNNHTFQNTVTFGNTSVNGTINSTSMKTTSLSGNLTGNVVATTISGNLTGNVTATTISGNLTGNVTATTISGNLTGNVSATNVNASSNVVVGNSTVFIYSNTTAHVGNVVATAVTGNLTGNVTATTISGNLTGNVVATTISGNLTGNVVATTISGNLTGNVAATNVSATSNVSVGNSTVNVYANNTTFVGNVVATSISGNLTGNVSATTISGNLTGNVVATTISGNLTGNVAATTISGNLTGNVVASTVNATSNVSVGNSTINVYANTTAFVGNVVATTISGNLTGNVAATTISGNLTGNVTATTISGNLTGNVVATTISGNLTGNVTATTISGNLTGNVVATLVSIGNSTVNVFANTTSFVGNTSGVHTGNVAATTISGNLTGNVVATTISGNLTGNVVATTISGNLTGNVIATTVNATTINATANIVVGSNMLINTTAIQVGNSTVRTIVNTTAFVGNVAATTISGNLTGNTSGTHTGAVVLGTSSLSANGGLGTAGHVLHSNGTATYWAADDQGVTSVASGNGITGGTITSTGTLSAVAGTGTVVNSTGIHVNATYIGTLSANNATYLNDQLASYYTNATNITTGTLPYNQIPANVINTTAAFTRTGITTFNANVVLGSSGLSANASFGIAGEVLHSNGTATYWAADDQGVTSVASGNGITGGTITSTGTLSVVAGTGVVVNATGVHVSASYVQNTDSRVLSGNLQFTGANVVVNTQLIVNSTVINSGGVYATTFTGNLSGNVAATNVVATTIVGSSVISGPNFIARGGSLAAGEGGQIILGYGNNLASSITGQANNTFNIDVIGGNTGSTPLLRIFAQHNDGTTTTALSVANTGRVHVGGGEQTDSTFKVTGTANITSTLSAGNTTVTGFANVVGYLYVSNTSDITPTTSWGGQITVGANGYSGGIAFDGTGMWIGHNSTSRSLILATNETERMRVDGSGNVGIGTVSPAYKLEVNGSFAATTKSFVIDHPTKPDMKLRYGSLEGPENGVYVRGRVRGSYIYLPDYWSNLVDDASITVSLTPIGNTSMPSVLSYNNHKIVLDNSAPIDCFYHVYGERKDVDKLVVEF